MLSNRPNAIKPNAHIFMNQEQTREIPAKMSPKTKALRGEILPDGIGRPLVLSIIASISLSLYPVSVSAAAEPAAIAKNNKINVQMRTVSRSTGTDTESFAYANDGCPSVLISIPLRYMHTTVEMLHRKDIEETILLMYETLLELSPKTNLSYL